MPSSATGANPVIESMEVKAAGDLARMLELRRWLRGLGCCWACTLTFACLAVEREAYRDVSGLELWCAEPGRLPACRDVASKAWPTRPKRDS